MGCSAAGACRWSGWRASGSATCRRCAPATRKTTRRQRSCSGRTAAAATPLGARWASTKMLSVCRGCRRRRHRRLCRRLSQGRRATPRQGLHRRDHPRSNMPASDQVTAGSGHLAALTHHIGNSSGSPSMAAQTHTAALVAALYHMQPGRRMGRQTLICCHSCWPTCSRKRMRPGCTARRWQQQQLRHHRHRRRDARSRHSLPRRRVHRMAPQQQAQAARQKRTLAVLEEHSMPAVMLGCRHMATSRRAGTGAK